ncbi:ribonuclease E inhibitor RraB [Shewanella gelidii]|nr:ribonuclease E inhibitor RraB [Shewanella gelidii]MCL1099474.1 ribonuclease E inhibitor RraB [Shewanella gelidii]
MQITREALETFFEDTREFTREHDAKFDIDQECRWSFYFADRDERRLTDLGSHLESEGYEPIGFLEADADDDDPDVMFLRVDMVETHTVDSLAKRNAEFYELASEYGILQYEGMDVGEVDGLF